MRDGSELELAGDPPLPGYLARPGAGTGRGLLVLHEASGLDDSIRDVCDRFARAGYVALAPDLYRGRRAAGSEEALRLARELEPEALARDLASAVQHLLGEHSVEGARLGAVGFCTGGQLALFAASRSRRVGAVVDFYGFHPALPVDLAKLEAAVLGIFAGDDPYIPAARVDELRRELEAAGVRAHLRVEPGVGHGFMNHARAERFDASAAAAGWDRMLAFLRAELA